MRKASQITRVWSTIPWFPAVLVFALYTLIYAAFINRATPFRAEHWALLQSYIQSHGWGETLRNISEFECFGDRRVQPLAFFPTIASFAALGTWFFGHYILSIFLHCTLTLFAIALLHRLRTGETNLSVLFLASAYPLPAALFLVAFPMADLLLWTFYHYLQVALCLVGFSSLLLLKNQNSLKERLLAYTALYVATLIYEPFITLLFVAFVLAAWDQRGRIVDLIVSIGLLSTLVPKYFTEYRGYLQLVTEHSELQRTMVDLPILDRAIYLVYKWTLLWTNALWNLVTLTSADKRHVYEMSPPTWIKAQLFERHTFLYLPEEILIVLTLALGITLLLLTLQLLRKPNLWKTPPWRAVLFCVGGALGPYCLVALGRPVVQSVSVSVQFRYVLISFLFALPLIFWAAEQCLPKKIRIALAIYLIAINSMSTLQHATHVRADLDDLSREISRLKREGATPDQQVKQINHSLAQLKLPIRQPDNYLFVYNAQKCIMKYYTP